jgi:hypothetical protein
MLDTTSLIIRTTYIVREDRNVIHTVNRRRANWIGHILCMKCFRKHVGKLNREGIINVTGR